MPKKRQTCALLLPLIAAASAMEDTVAVLSSHPPRSIPASGSMRGTGLFRRATRARRQKNDYYPA